jgi:hypothetical protein
VEGTDFPPTLIVSPALAIGARIAEAGAISDDLRKLRRELV